MKIVIISQHIFPMKTPRAHRTTELVKEFGRLGHEVIVYAVLGNYNYTTFENEYGVKVKNIPIRFQYKKYNSDGYGERAFLDKVLAKLLGKLFEFPSIEFVFQIPNILKNENQVDLLISIADPHPIHWGCSRAKIKYPKNFPKKWIADCGDPFMADVKNKIHYQYYRRFEKQFCRLCDNISVPIEEAIDAYYPEYRTKIKVIPQGFEFETPVLVSTNKLNEVPTFAYAGIFYRDIRNPKLLFEYLKSLDIKFKFIIYTKYKELIEPYVVELKDKLEVREPIDRLELIKVLKKMDFLINIENQNSPNQFPSKIIDYTIAGRPILSINNLNFNSQVIEDFLKGNYKEAYILKNIENYHISNVARQFISLVQ